MQTIIVPNGGDGGALLVTLTTAVPVALSDPAVRDALRATSHLAHAMLVARDDRMRNRFAKMAVGSANLAVELIEAAFGPLDQDRAIVYQGTDNGFTCGSNGKPPIPFPWPAKNIGTIDDLMRSRVVAPDIIDLVRQAKAQGSDLGLLVEAPQRLAEQLGVSLSEKSAADLALLSPDAIGRIKDPVQREAIGLFHAVLKDGRFTDTWFERPYEVARELNINISEAALLRSIAVVNTDTDMAGFGAHIAVGIVWAGVCIAVGTAFVGQMNPIDSLIEDRSGVAKL